MNKTVVIQNSLGNVNIGYSPEYRVDSVINELLIHLAATPFKFEIRDRKVPVAAVRKIQYNNIRMNRHIIQQYLEHSAAIETAYERIDNLIPFGRGTVLRNIKNLYYQCLDAFNIDYFGDIDICQIRENSDQIIEFIVNSLKNLAFESRNVPSMKEHVMQGINVIVAHAFIECIVLEVPSDAAASRV